MLADHDLFDILGELDDKSLALAAGAGENVLNRGFQEARLLFRIGNAADKLGRLQKGGDQKGDGDKVVFFGVSI